MAQSLSTNSDAGRHVDHERDDLPNMSALVPGCASPLVAGGERGAEAMGGR